MRFVTRLCIPATLLVSLVTGTAADAPRPRDPIAAGPYQVLSADFHLHSGMWSGGSLTPWGLVLEAERQGLDLIALTGHNETIDAHVARTFARIADGPMVLVGEEITSPTQDLIAIGITSTISPYLPLHQQIAEVHRQGGFAIAPHPLRRFWSAYAPELTSIDGSEVCHPVRWETPEWGGDLIAFFAQAPGAMPIGSSDFHFNGHPGSCRTFLFVRAATTPGVLEALRARRTVVYGPDGRAYGAPELVRLADAAGLRQRAERFQQARGTPLDWVSRGTALAGLLGIAWAIRPRASRRAAARP